MVTAIPLIRLVSPKLVLVLALTLLVPIRIIVQMRVITMVQGIALLPMRSRRRGINTGIRSRVGSTRLRAIASNLESRIKCEEEKEPDQEPPGLLAVDIADVFA